MKLPFVSVIITTLNEEKNIENCIKSIKNQDYKGKYEIIVADGCSKDRTVEIAKEYADKVLLVEKIGVSAGRNAGAKAARGKILVFMDADTMPIYNFLKTVDKTFKNQKTIAANCPVLPLRYSNKELLTYWMLNEIIFKPSIRIKSPIMGGMTIVCRKSVFEMVGGFNEDTKILEDVEFSKKLTKYKGEFEFMDDTLVLTSTRRLRKWGFLKQINTWFLGYLKLLKLLNKQITYSPVR